MNRAGEREQLQAPFMADRGQRRRGTGVRARVKAGGELGKKSADDLATLAGKTGRAPPTATHGVGAASGGLLPLYRALLSTGNGMGEAV